MTLECLRPQAKRGRITQRIGARRKRNYSTTSLRKELARETRLPNPGIGEQQHRTELSRGSAPVRAREFRDLGVSANGDLAVATGHSSYRSSPGGPLEKTFDNCFIMRFDPDGRCLEFTEWFMRRPDASHE